MAVLLPTVVTIAVYMPDALRRSAWSDDYPFLESDNFAKFFADGRPVQGFLFEAVFPDNVNDLATLRAIGVLGIAVFAGLLTVLLTGWGVSSFRASLWATSAVFLPPFHEYAGWATLFAIPWLSLVGVLAGALWIGRALPRRWVSHMAAVLGITMAMLVYPPAAMFCWVPLGLRILVCRMRASDAFREIARLSVLVAGAGLITLLAAPVVRNIRGIPTDPRVQVITSPQEMVEKIIWFVSHPVVVAARPFAIASPGAVEALITGGSVLAITAIGILVTSKGTVASRIGTLCAIAMCCALTMAPHLIVPDNQIEYRFMGGLTVLVWGCACVAGSRLFQLGTGWLPAGLRNTIGPVGSQLPVMCLTLLVPLTAYLAVTNVRDTFIDPSTSKERFLLDSLSGYDPLLHDRILVIDHHELWQNRPNLGIYSTTSDLAHGWVAEPNIRQLLNEGGRGQPLPDLEVVRDDVQPDSGDYVVDLRPYALSFSG